MKQLTIFFLFLLIIGCSHQTTKERTVTVTIEPQRYFAEKIARDKFIINSMVAAGLNPESYDPTPQQMVNLGQSEAYLKIGHIGFEQAWMENLIKNNAHLKVFDLSEGYHLIETGDHANCNEHGHQHGGVDPHIWSSISGAQKVAENTLAAFIALDPENEAYYTANYNELSDEIVSTKKELQQQLDSLQSRTFIIYHPALTYLADEFGLTQLCIEMDGKEPSPALLKELIETARNNQAKVVFIQQEFDQKNAELIAKETGCKLIVINPLAYNWHDELVRIAMALNNQVANK